MTTDIRDLLRACALSPDEDTPRLALADAIDEHATTDAERARAELIRVQIRLVNPPWNSEDMLRAGRLIRTHGAAWRRPPCPACRGNGGGVYGLEETEWSCPTCHGTGSCGAFSEQERVADLVVGGDWKTQFVRPVAYVRGLPVVTVQFAEIGGDWYEDGENQGWRFRPEWLAWAIRAVREEGVSFECSDWHMWPPQNLRVILDEVPRVSKKWPVVSNNDYDAALTRLVVERAYPKVEDVNA